MQFHLLEVKVKLALCLHPFLDCLYCVFVLKLAISNYLDPRVGLVHFANDVKHNKEF